MSGSDALGSGSLRPKKFKMQSLAGKVMAIVFYNSVGFQTGVQLASSIQSYST